MVGLKLLTNYNIIYEFVMIRFLLLTKLNYKPTIKYQNKQINSHVV